MGDGGVEIDNKRQVQGKGWCNKWNERQGEIGSWSASWSSGQQESVTATSLGTSSY